MGFSSRCPATSGWPMIASLANFSARKTPSMAASVAGWCSAMSFPCRSPVGNSCRQHAINPATTPMRRLGAPSFARPCSVQNAPMPATTKAPVITAPLMLCRKAQMAQGLSTNCQKWAICSLPFTSS
jgi:hypothetical protein